MQQFDIIVSNPPYISYAEWIHLDPSVRDYESPRALIADNEGYAIIESIIKNASMYIMQNNLLSLYKIPQLYMEIGYNQAKNVETFLRVHGYVNIELWQDYNGHTRVVCGRVSNAVHSRDS
jgi:release factor glutamine methyltransferase